MILFLERENCLLFLFPFFSSRPSLSLSYSSRLFFLLSFPFFFIAMPLGMTSIVMTMTVDPEKRKIVDQGIQ